MKNLEHALKLCLVTKNAEYSLRRIALAVQGGITMVQLREKSHDIGYIIQLAKELQKITKPFGVPLIINDHPEIAAEVDADGVHLGNGDMTPQLARKILGPNKIIGVSIESISDLHAANLSRFINYVTASAIFPSKTKPDCRTIWGLNGLSALAARSIKPLTAIGGITSKNIDHIMSSGAQGIAVIGAIYDEFEPVAAAQNLRKAIDKYHRTNQCYINV